MTDDITHDLADFDLPFGRKASLKRIEFDGGLEVLRLTLREGRRFTVIDLDREGADAMGRMLCSWANGSPDKT